MANIWKNIPKVLGFGTISDSVGNLFKRETYSSGNNFARKVLTEPWLEWQDAWNDLTSGGQGNSTNSAVSESNGGLSVNSNGSINLNNVNSLDQLGTVVAEAVLGGIPEFQRLWSSAENQKARDWETEMSNSAYQRSVADMKAAGINPILAYSQGGASTPTSAVTGASSSGSSLGSTMNGISSLIKTIMSEDRMSDAQADKAALAALKYKDTHSATEAHNDYLKTRNHIEMNKALSQGNLNYSRANWYDRH